MPRPRTIACSLAVLLAIAVLGGCSAPKTIQVAWPVATSERVVPRPAGSIRWPLTGLPAPSTDAILARVVSVKIENSPAARPQTGLDKADIVYETITEGGITRFNALFQSQIPPTAGPVRSARPSDFYIVPQYLALFAHAGGDAAVRAELKNRSLFDDMDQFLNPSPYTRIKGRVAPHNLYVNIAALRVAAVQNRGYEATATVAGPAFAASSATPTPTVSVITVPFSSSNTVTWKFDPTGDVYGRSINGKAHMDAVTKRQYTARNVVVLWALTKKYTAAGAASPVLDIQLTGTGRATVFRDGTRFDGTWQASATSPPVLRDGSGQVITLGQGNTWFQVISNDLNISMK
jgi:hypothetical protein